MKKQGISALLLLLLMLLIPVTASADVIYPAPEAFVAGTEVDHLLATLDPGGTVWTDPALLPEGLSLETEETAEGVNVYLRGVPTVPGTYDLLIVYNDTESVCSVTVLPPFPVSVSVETLPDQTSYTAGDLLDPEGLTLRVTMSDGTETVVSEDYALSPVRLDQAGKCLIEVNYQGLLCYFEVEVAPASELIEGIGVLSLPYKVVYDLGEDLDPLGLSIRVYTNNGTRDVEAGEELICTPTQLTDPGLQEITVFYEDHSCVFTVQVLEPEAPASIAVFRLPEKLDYLPGEELDTSGLVLIETSNRDNPSYMEQGFTCEPTRLDEVGHQEITVSVGDLNCSFYVTVHAAAPSPAEPSAAPAQPKPVPAAPTAAVIQPQPDPIPPRTVEPDARSASHLAGILIGAALAALAVLALYVLVIKRSARDLADSAKELFRRRR